MQQRTECRTDFKFECFFNGRLEPDFKIVVGVVIFLAATSSFTGCRLDTIQNLVPTHVVSK
jgi:hypothetical protein